VEVSGKIHKADYEHFAPEFERLVKQHGKLRLLMVMKDFHGWDLGALWEDIKFDIHHFSDIERIAMVGDKAWQEGMATFCKPFTKAKISYFPQHQLAEARTWLAEA
jgi:hypothetical protein